MLCVKTLNIFKTKKKTKLQLMRNAKLKLAMAWWDNVNPAIDNSSNLIDFNISTNRWIWTNKHCFNKKRTTNIKHNTWWEMAGLRLISSFLSNGCDTTKLHNEPITSSDCCWGWKNNWEKPKNQQKYIEIYAFRWCNIICNW